VGTTGVRPLTIKDKSAVMSLLRATPEFLPPEVVVAEELIDAYLEEEKASGYYIYVAEHDGDIAGYVCYGDTPLTEATWDLYWIAVDHEKQGFGIGRILMNMPKKISSECTANWLWLRHQVKRTIIKPDNSTKD
jgi:GNAT superfamily N-acetyltransferase